jgi:seryl-tRNA synthetase
MEAVVAKSIADWIQEGEELYESALKQFEEMDTRLRQLEKQLAQKQDEVNQIAQVIGKPLVEGNRRLTAQLVDDHGPLSVPNSSTTIARALSGRNINR